MTARRRALPAVVAMSLVSGLALAAPATATPLWCTNGQWFRTAGPSTCLVPDGVSALTVEAWGASGGTNGRGQSGGLGAKVTSTLAVVSGDALTMVVGGAGSSASYDVQLGALGGAGGSNGGGVGGSAFLADGIADMTAGGGGGGATDVALLRNEVALPVLTAGGGGGGGSGSVGGAGGAVGETGGGGFGSGGAGATAEAPGAGGLDGGSPGVGREGGAGVVDVVAYGAFAYGGGGGGGGVFGGGGGGAFPDGHLTAGAGGGGSSIADPELGSDISIATEDVYNDGAGAVRVTWPAMSALTSTLSPLDATIDADGTSDVELTVQAVDGNGHPMSTGGDNVTITKWYGDGDVSPVTDHHDGTYTAKVTSTVAGSGTFLASVDDVVLRGGTLSWVWATITYTEAAQAHTVTFDANGGTGPMEPQSSTDPTQLTSNTFIRDGYAFAGWSTDPQGEQQYADGATYSFASDATLYAQWTFVGYTVTFDANGGTGTMAPQTMTGSNTLTHNAFERTGYRFVTWSTTPGGQGSWYRDAAVYDAASSATLYAIWTDAGPLSATPTDFGSVTVGQHQDITVTVTNTGNGRAQFSNSSVYPSNVSAMGGTCPLSGGTDLAAGATCTVVLRWTPTAAGALTDAGLLIQYSGLFQEIPLSGTGVGPVPGPLSFSSGVFASTVVGSSSPLTVTVTNLGSGAMTPATIAPTGTGVSVTGGTCHVSTAVAAGDTCTVVLAWQPTSVGSLASGLLSITYTGGIGHGSVALTGTATAAPVPGPLTFSSGAFGSTVVGTAVARTVTVTNTGTASLTPSVITPSGRGVTITGGTCSVSTPIPSDEACTVTLSWLPTSAGALSGGSLAISYTGGVGSNSLPLSGSAASAATAPGAPTRVVATPRVRSASVSWTPPARDGGSRVTSYVVTSAPSGRTCRVAAPAHACIVAGLTAGVRYTFTVRAINAIGTSAASARSGTVVPTALTRRVSARVLYGPMGSSLSASARATLRRLVSSLPHGAVITSVVVTGYVQQSGTSSNDTPLSRARARAVATYLRSLGVTVHMVMKTGGVGGSTAAARSASVVVTYQVR